MHPILIVTLALSLITAMPAYPLTDRYDHSYAVKSEGALFPEDGGGLIHPFYRSDTLLDTQSDHPVYKGEPYDIKPLS